MAVEKAKSYYLGQNGYKRMNCAQSIISVFMEDNPQKESLIEAFGRYGGGNAPEGLCGAFYAAKYILENNYNMKRDDFERYFMEHTGALKCHEIKGLRKLSCVGCVEKSAEFLHAVQEDGEMPG